MSKNKILNLSLLLILLLVGILLLLPMISIFLHAMEEYDPKDVDNFARVLEIPFPVNGKQIYQALILERETVTYFWNSMKITVPTVFLNLCIALPGGYSLAKFQYPFKRFFFFCYVLVMLLPVQVSIVGTYIFFEKIHLLDQVLGIILASSFAPLGTFLIFQSIKTIPDSSLESARIEGANEWCIFWKIVIPQIKAGIASMFILILMDTWNMVELPMYLLKSVSKQPMSLMLRFVQLDESNTIFASILISAIPMLLIFMLC